MDTKPRILIIGIGGLVGYKLANLARNDFEIFGSYNLRNPCLEHVHPIQLDITNSSNVEHFLKEILPSVVINTAALTSVDYCENHHDVSNKINYQAVDYISKITDRLGIKLVHLSTDSVFDGTKNIPYTETDSPKPINQYGKSKLLGENVVLKNSSNLIIRASVLYGWIPHTLVKKETSSMKSLNFAQWLITKLQKMESVNIITDEYSSPIIAEDLTNSILHLIKKNMTGVFHSAPPINISRYEFSIKLAEFLGLNSKLIHPISTKELRRNVTTGTNKCLNSQKLQNTEFKFLSLEESFKILKKQMNS